MSLTKKEKFAKLPKLKTLKYVWCENGRYGFWYLPYFHNYEYRHLLRSPDHLQNWTKKPISAKKFDLLYDNLATELTKKKLKLNGHSKKHTKVIAEVLKLPEVIDVYNQQESVCQ